MNVIAGRVLLVLAVCASRPLMAGGGGADAPVYADTGAKFETVSARVRNEMQEGGRYSYVTPDERSTVEARLAEMRELFEKRDSTANMSDDEKMRMFNDQEAVNAILTRRDGERLVCSNEKPVGSHIPVRTCRTVAEIERWKHHGDDFMKYNERLHQRRGPNGSGEYSAEPGRGK